MKPTKQQVKGTIAFMADCPMSLVSYDYKKKEFSYIEIVPKPHYDSGHGIDAMDYDEIPSTISWKEALKCFRYYKRILHTYPTKCPAPIAPIETDETDLPF